MSQWQKNNFDTDSFIIKKYFWNLKSYFRLYFFFQSSTDKIAREFFLNFQIEIYSAEITWYDSRLSIEAYNLKVHKSVGVINSLFPLTCECVAETAVFVSGSVIFIVIMLL